MSDVESIEFLDLTDVDEKEQIRVRASLLQTDSSVQLPWLKTSKKTLNIKRGKEKETVNHAEPTRPVITNHEYMFPAVPVAPIVNNLYPEHHFHQAAAVVMPPLVPNYGALQSNTVYYTKTLSPVPAAYPQPVFVIPQSTVNNVIHNYPYTATTQTVRVNNAVTDSFIIKTHADTQQQDYGNGSTTQTIENNSAPCVTGKDVVFHSSQAVKYESFSQEVPVEVTQESSSTVVQNGVKAKESTSTSSPANKSWASLFASNKSNGASIQTPEVGVEKPKTVLTEFESNNENLCPIKHPRKAKFIDPDCYRMGEFLTNYSVDGRAVSLQPRGLINQSNYCYINSILQALIACPPFYNLLCGLSQNISSNEKRKPTPVIDGICRFVKEFKHLPANMRVSNRRSDGKVQKKEQGILINTDIPFEPSWIYKMLNGIRTDLIEGRQEDAEEFLGCLLNGLNDEMLELMKIVKNDCDGTGPKPESSDNEDDLSKEWQVMGPKNKGSVTRRTDFGKTPISDIFGGFLKSRIHRTGDHVTENIQPFFTLQLNIEKAKTVREALEGLVTKYQLEGLTSSKTNEEVEAWQQVMLDELPVILVLHLKCFDFKLDGCTKIIKALEFPIDLKIDSKLLSSKTQTAKEKQYKLFAVVYHDGKEATKGHYVTDAFHVGYSSWIRYDDASVKPVLEEQVMKPQGTRVPYLLFYRRSDTIRSK
ncbi:hypothetical protein NQ315_006358 [Exocentrus adspersus]|uniref:ubiquitinyl hydrolase 1 n=1 Tax=Exocentrus adspersus TaxID=1586481 RepID=A0AAV8W0J7_9CUCU|nr:hypothetical protein NQ315_006358 [Exocentrus adspersus]